MRSSNWLLFHYRGLLGAYFSYVVTVWLLVQFVLTLWNDLLLRSGSGRKRTYSRSLTSFSAGNSAFPSRFSSSSFNDDALLLRKSEDSFLNLGEVRNVNRSRGIKNVHSQAELDGLPPLWLCQPNTVKARDIPEIQELLQQEDGCGQLSDQDILKLLRANIIKPHQLEKVLGDYTRAVHIRRKWVILKQGFASDLLDELPYLHYDYSYVIGACCENVMGYVTVPVGYAGPLKVNGQSFTIPLSTTEGCLVASINRGCRAVSVGSGVSSFMYSNSMTRGPVVRLPSAKDAVIFKRNLEERKMFELVKKQFDSTSRFARLRNIDIAIAGRLVYLRFQATTGDAMGMNMVSKGVERALQFLHSRFPIMEILSVSGNYCTDKKPSAVNWICGRGKSVVCDTVIAKKDVESILKTSVDALVELNMAKNLIGSAMSGTIGGYNAHSANIVTAIFLATGQDVAQSVSSSNCLTQVERINDDDLYVSCTMPSIEVGTVGGGTALPAQEACLKMLGISGGSLENPGKESEKLALIVGSVVLAGEISLLAALTTGDLVKSHMTHNRSQLNLAKTCSFSNTQGSFSEVPPSLPPHSSTPTSPVLFTIKDLPGTDVDLTCQSL